MDVISTSVGAGSTGIEKVVVHPLVLLSIVDNYNRVAKDTRKRVLGVLLGSTFRGRVDITNSYAGESSAYLEILANFSYSVSGKMICFKRFLGTSLGLFRVLSDC